MNLLHNKNKNDDDILFSFTPTHPKQKALITEEYSEENTKHDHLNSRHVRIVGESEEKRKCKNTERRKDSGESCCSIRWRTWGRCIGSWNPTYCHNQHGNNQTQENLHFQCLHCSKLLPFFLLLLLLFVASYGVSVGKHHSVLLYRCGQRKNTGSCPHFLAGDRFEVAGSRTCPVCWTECLHSISSCDTAVANGLWAHLLYKILIK